MSAWYPGAPAPDAPDDQRPGEDVFDFFRRIADWVTSHSEPLSVRARVFTSLERIIQRGQQILAADAAGDEPLGQIATTLELRDMARREQAWVDELLRDAEYAPTVTATLHRYKALLATMESAAIVTLGYLGSDREASAEAAWWAQRAGRAVPEMARIVQEGLWLPGEA